MDGSLLAMRNENNMQVKKNEGFTLVELMITMLLAGIITAAVYSAYRTQQRSYVTQEQVAELQQNIR
ncbi:MAG: prepilin-type N-terminal cleavage/methylation domain-containing protein, partial [Chlorobium sp.]|nr:prepilin-type N-terminal cleavage/methylation domain-containing protein [Chlorobium sp.]